MPSAVAAFAPARINLIGEHTDYNEGLALPFAIDTGITVRARARDGRRLHAVAADLDESDEFELEAVQAVGGWQDFVRGAVGELQRSGVEVPGAAVEISGSVPRGAGLSSSAALEVALVLALRSLAGAPSGDRTELAKLCSRIENDWVGARTGLLDQLASLYGDAGRALRIDFHTLEVRPVALDLDEHTLVVLDSGEHHENASSGYNQRRAECARACELLGIPSLRDATLEAAQTLPDPLDRRVRHVVTSNGRVDRFTTALEHRDFAAMGALLDESHASLRDDYEVSAPELDLAVSTAVAAGAHGARMTGGGFGGSAIALVDRDVLQDVQDAVLAAFAEHGYTEPQFFPAVASAGAHRIA